MHGQGHVADFVEEKGSPVGIFKAAFAIAAGIGICAANVAEEFVLEGGFIEAGAIKGDEAFAGAFGILVESAGDEFFAGAVLTEDQDADVGRGELADALEDAAHGLGLSDDAAFALEAEADIEGTAELLGAAGEEDFFAGAANLGPDDLKVERFLDEVIEALRAWLRRRWRRRRGR